jgi:hypothetical protein
MRRRFLFAAAALALTGVLAGPAWANDGEFHGSGATVYPVASAAIAMDEEDLEIRQVGPAVGTYVQGWAVKVTYRFRNTADAPVRIRMGFPERCVAGPEDIDADPWVCREPSIRNFTVVVDGKPVKATVKAARKGSDGEAGPLPGVVFQRVHTFPVEFGPGQTRTVVHTYDLRPSIIAAYTSVMEYILQTGRLWQGPIRRLDIRMAVWDRFESMTVQGEGVPAPTKGQDGEWTVWSWRLTDVEPTFDLELHFERPDALDRAEALSAACGHEDAALAAMDAPALRLLRNTVYAAYGYGFRSDDLKAHFAAQPWYRPRADYAASWLDPWHAKCVQRIKAAEAKKKAVAEE